MKPSEESKIKMEQRAISAIDAMKSIGITPQVTRSVLRSLLKTYDNQWEYIEGENYRLLADAIFDPDIAKDGNSKRRKDEEADAHDNGEANLDRCVSNRKRPGTEIIPMSSGAEAEFHRVCKNNDGNSKRRKDEEADALDNGEANLDRGVSNMKRPGKEIISMSSGAEAEFHRVCKNNLDSGQRNMKRSGKELVETYTGVASVWDEPSRDVRLDSPANGDVNLSLTRMKKVAERNIIPKQEDCLRLNKKVGENSGNGKIKKKLKPTVPEPPSANSTSLVVVQEPHVVIDTVKRLVNPRDITNGQERRSIPLVCDDDDASNDFPNFHYIRHNVIYQKASVPISLARIGDEYCCKDCYGDCLKASIPCPCAGETGGEFAYTSEGLLRDDFLDSYLNKCRHTQEHHLHYCKICPIERIKNELRPEKCKGHLIGTFIKECWIKCGCSRQCRNRVVQHGIRCHLEVFYTDKRKGWGLRSPNELPRGTFVCEYAGEILTNMELHERTVNATGSEKHTYPVMLDADWASEGILVDEESLCLDATNYGNVARFMNHRCCDPNLVEIPVEIETPDHHYYHVAFFTSRKVEPYEELCWDYGIDFYDHEHPIKAFRCSCGSKQCRDKTRRKA